MGLYNELTNRGFVKQMTTEAENMEKLLDSKQITVYAGFDPTKESLHIGHLIPVMALAHMQKFGHRPIFLIGGGTALIGDPSGKDSMREMLTPKQIEVHIAGIKKQLRRFVDFDDDKALLLNNFDWIGPQNYIEFIRNVGPHFTVNRMLAAECFKQRMEKGLTFLEFNYMLLQAFDFYELHREYNCSLEVGGDDQWSNIIAGIELVRRRDQKEVFGLTFPLLTKADGKKMGKTEGGSVWLDPNLTSPFDYYQYWRNTLDADVIRFLKLYTFLSLEEIAEYAKYEGAELNKVKEILAYEQTKIVHGEEEAKKARETAQSLFSGSKASLDSAAITELKKTEVVGSNILELLIKTDLFSTKGEAKRMIKQGGLSMNGAKVNDPNYLIEETDINSDNKIELKKGKKKFSFIEVK